ELELVLVCLAKANISTDALVRQLSKDDLWKDAIETIRHMTDPEELDETKIAMDEDRFWKIIEEGGKGCSKDDDLKWHEQLVELLRNLIPEEIYAFQTIFAQKLVDACCYDLWGAAYILGAGGCSESDFKDVRTWLVCQGRDEYYKLLKDPTLLFERFTP